MNETTKRRGLHLLLLAAILAACLASVFAIQNFTTGSYRNGGGVVALADGWQYETASGAQELPPLPTAVPWCQEGITITRRLPEQLPKNPTLEFISRQSKVEVILEGETIHSYGLTNKSPVGNLLGNIRNVVHLPYDAGGKEISICLTCPYPQSSSRIADIFLGSREAVMYRFMVSNLDVAIFCLFSLFFCLMTLVAAVFFKFKHVGLHGVSLGFFVLFILISATWVITDCNILQIITPNFPVVYFISHLSFMLMPMPLLIFLRENTSYKPGGYGILLVLSVVCFFLRVGLFFAGIVDLETSLPLTHLVMVACAIVCSTLLAREWAKEKLKTVLLFLLGFIALGLCLVISLVLFMFSNSLDYSVFFRIMLTVMMGAMFYNIFSQFAAMGKQSIETQLYQKLAYTDSMTGMRNRTSFAEQMEAIQTVPDCRTLTIAVFDIDRLKYANDTYGHSAGDDLIRCAARHIQATFGDVGSCYRIGGDEFSVILKDLSQTLLQEKMDHFHAGVAQTVLSTQEGLHISVGLATGPAQGERFAYRLFDQADSAMYQDKNSHCL